MTKINFLRLSRVKSIILIVVMLLSWYLTNRFTVVGPTQSLIAQLFSIVTSIAILYFLVCVIYGVILKLKLKNKKTEL